MSQNTINLLQAIGVTVQILNAGIGTVTHDAAIVLIVGAIAGGFQIYVQRLGNASTPQPPAAKGTAA